MITGIKEEESRVFTIESNTHLGVTDALSAVKSSFSPGLCKHLQRKALQKRCICKRFREYCFRVCVENDAQFPEN